MSGDVTIIPPGAIVERGTPRGPNTWLVWEGGQRVPTGARVWSGCWWVYVGRPNDVSARWGHDGSIIVNGSTLLFPRRQWFVCENYRCMALRNSAEPMLWLEGDVLWEKEFGEFGEIIERIYGGPT